MEHLYNVKMVLLFLAVIEPLDPDCFKAKFLWPEEFSPEKRKNGKNTMLSPKTYIYPLQKKWKEGNRIYSFLSTNLLSLLGKKIPQFRNKT